MKYQALVKLPAEEIIWLVIESDQYDTGGFFVYYHTSGDHAYDTWHMTLEDAFAVGEDYEIARSDWKLVDKDITGAEIVLLELVDTSKGVIALLDYPKYIYPLIGQRYQLKGSATLFVITGVALPVPLENVRLDLVMPYQSAYVHHCVLQTSGPNVELKKGAIFVLQ